MATSDLAEFNAEVEASVKNKDGERLRDLFRAAPDSLTARALVHYYKHGGELPGALDEPWTPLATMVEKRFAAIGAMNLNQWVDAYEHMAQCLSTYLGVLSNDSDWSMALFHMLSVDVRIMAECADEQLRAEGAKPCKLESAERILKRGFSTTNNDRRAVGKGSRKTGTLGAINQLLKVYFKLNNLRLCVNLTRTVNNANFPTFEHFPMEHRVTYKYYAGRLSLYENEYQTAVKELSYALENTAVHFVKHRRRILLYLIPAKILTGSLPSERMLKHFNMHWFSEIAGAIKTGNLSRFDKALAAHEEFFIQCALYLAVERMRPLVYRSLCKKVSTILGTIRIRLEDVLKCLVASEVDGIDYDEVECIMANLIFQGYIKGYISHKHRYLVLSKKDPFPNLSNLPVLVGGRR